jgi:hypothetical protein
VALRSDEALTTQNGQLVREVRRLRPEGFEELADGDLLLHRQHLEDADAHGVAEALEHVGHELVVHAVRIRDGAHGWLLVGGAVVGDCPSVAHSNPTTRRKDRERRRCPQSWGEILIN